MTLPASFHRAEPPRGLFPARDHFLVVDDEHLTRHVLERLLERSGYTSDCASSGLEAITRLGEGAYDAMLLDLRLPDIDGRHLIRAARSRSGMLILVLAEQASSNERINALDLGADDVITKPFHPEELLARIRAIRRRQREVELPPAQPLVEPDHSVGIRDLEHLDFAPREMQIFRLLHRRANQVVSSSEIVGEVWGKDTSYTRKRVRTLIGALRRHLARENVPLKIESEYGNGYRLIM